MKYSLGKCPMCGEGTEVRSVHHAVTEEPNVVFMTVDAEVCQVCGHQGYDIETVEQMEQVRARMVKGYLSGFKPMGRTFSLS